MAKQTTKQKFITESAIGKEPKWTELPENESERHVLMMKTYSWYNMLYDGTDAKKFLVSWMRANKYKNVQDVQKQTIVLPTVGWIARLKVNGCPLPEETEEWFKVNVKKVVERAKVVKSEEQKALIEKTKKVRKHDPVDNFIDELEEVIDDAMINDYNTSFSCEAWIKTSEIGPIQAKQVAEFYRPLIEEIKRAQTLDNEGYEHLGKRKLNRYFKFIDDLVTTLDKHGTIVRKRKKKVIKPEVKVKDFKYQKADKELGITSIDPKTIIGANIVLVFDTQKRKLVIYEAMTGEGIDIKGTSLLNAVARSKTIRKPNEQLTEFMECSKVQFNKLFKDIKAKESEHTKRTSDNSLILRVYK